MFHANTENYGDQENAHGLTKKKEKITKKKVTSLRCILFRQNAQESRKRNVCKVIWPFPLTIYKHAYAHTSLYKQYIYVYEFSLMLLLFFVVALSFL